ncbi:MFS transporter [Ktedonosporobacter rubrisoli]|uniref:MFS transporter n=1 Tax=Ktedonosporobacter rubrisoli TaxID=2509675 RepID=A0A4P6JL60_KTERU|nr:MFS transporter [Ktedonosporobacter rubrisoli]QBD75750.1 MFS transporter [Ktedonosporobacter rubrisoli]
MHTMSSEHEKTNTADLGRADVTSTGQHVDRKKRINKSLFILPASLALIMTGFGIIIPVYPQRLEALGLGAETLALMEGGFGLGMFLFSTPMGVWANRFGRKPLVLLALLGFVATNLLLAFVNIPAFFIAIRFLEGILVAGFMPAAMAMIGDAIPPEKQGRWMGVMTTAQAGGVALGPAIGGVLYQSWGFTSPFLLSAAFALASALLAIFMLPETLPEQVRAEALANRDRKKRGEKELDVNRVSLIHLAWAFAALLFIDFGSMFVFPFALPQYPFFFENTLHYSAAQYGLIISADGLAMALFPLVLGRLSDTLPKKPLVIIGSLLSASLNLAMLFLHQYPLLIVSSLMTGVGFALLMPSMSTIYLQATSDKNRSQLMGIRSTAISFAMLAAPLAQAAIAPWITPQITFAISSVLSLLMVIFAIVALKSPRQSSPEDASKIAA